MTNVALRLCSLALGVLFSFLLVKMSDQENANWVIEFFTISLVLSTLFDFGGSGDIIRASDEGGFTVQSILYSLFPIPVVIFIIISGFSLFTSLDFVHCVGGLMFTCLNRLTTAHRYGKFFTFSYLANELVHNLLKLSLIVILWWNSFYIAIEFYALLTVCIPILILMTKDSGCLERTLTHSLKYSLGSLITTSQSKFPLLFIMFHGQSNLSQTNFVLSICTGSLGLIFAYVNKLYAGNLSEQKVRLIPKIAFISCLGLLFIAYVLSKFFLFDLPLVLTTVTLVVQGVLLNPVFTKTGEQGVLNKIDFLQIFLVFLCGFFQKTLICFLVTLCFLIVKLFWVRPR